MLGNCGGEEVGTKVEEVGTGVGYVEIPPSDSRARRFTGRGRVGEDVNGSNGGSSEAGRFVPAAAEALGHSLEGDESMTGVDDL